MRKATGRKPHQSIRSKTLAWVPEFAVEDLPSAQLKPGRTFPWAENSDDDGNKNSKLHFIIVVMVLFSNDKIN